MTIERGSGLGYGLPCQSDAREPSAFEALLELATGDEVDLVRIARSLGNQRRPWRADEGWRELV